MVDWRYYVSICFLNRRYIDALVDSKDEVGEWRLTSFYGNPETHRRIESWELIKQLGKQIDLP